MTQILFYFETYVMWMEAILDLYMQWYILCVRIYSVGIAYAKLQNVLRIKNPVLTKKWKYKRNRYAFGSSCLCKDMFHLRSCKCKIKLSSSCSCKEILLRHVCPGYPWISWFCKRAFGSRISLHTQYVCPRYKLYMQGYLASTEVPL